MLRPQVSPKMRASASTCAGRISRSEAAAALDSRRPDGPRRGVRAVERTAARASPVNAAAWRLVRPVRAALRESPRATVATPGCSVGDGSCEPRCVARMAARSRQIDAGDSPLWARSAR